MLLQALCIISYPSVNSNLSCSPETLNSGQNRQFFEPCDLEIWRMTLKNNRAPPLCYFKLCASFRSHWWIQTGVTVQKRPIWVKFDDFLSLWPWPLTSDLDLLHGHHFGPWTSLWSLVITPEDFMMIRWWEHCQKGVTDRQTDGNSHS